MSWAGLSTNQFVSFTDAQGSGLTQKVSLITSNQFMDKDDANYYLDLDPQYLVGLTSDQWVQKSQLINGATNEVKYGKLYNGFAVIPKGATGADYFYNWYAVTDAKNIAASGWHVSTNAEWNTLNTYLINNGYSYGLDYGDVAKSLASAANNWLASTDLNDPGNNPSSNNRTGFNAKPRGVRGADGAFSINGSGASYWNSNEDSSTTGSIVTIGYDSNNPSFYGQSKKQGNSVRLVKDSTNLTHGQTGTYTGNNGTTYTTICIGTQEWMSENLRETLYRDTTAIPEQLVAATWAGLTTGARCTWLNTISNAGWHVATDAEWTTLTDYLTNNGYGYGGSGNDIAMSMASKLYWASASSAGQPGYDKPNNNSSGLGLHPTGYRSGSYFYYLTNFGIYWTGTEWPTNTFNIWGRRIDWNSATLSTVTYYEKRYGFPVRLIKDDSTTATYTGNDGKVYSTVKIGNQVWMAENLRETKYYDGSTIPNITDGTTWYADTTGAWCSYDNA